jgi:hypothetical protein
MGWFDGTSIVSDDKRDGDRHRRRSSSGKKHHSSSRSIFGFGDDQHGSSHHNASRSSFFSFGMSLDLYPIGCLPLFPNPQSLGLS